MRRTTTVTTPASRSPRAAAGLLAGLLLSGLALAAGPAPAAANPGLPREDAETIVSTAAAGVRALTAAASAGTASRSTTRRPTAAAGDPVPAPTRGTVSGRVLTPAGDAYAGALVQGIRFSDLGRGLDHTAEQPVQVRTDSRGRFRLPQLTERYLLKVCDAGPTDDQCGSDDAPDRYATTYVGPDGVRDSWVTQTRLFRPVQPVRTVATFRMKPYAQLSGTVRDARPGSSVRLVRGNGTDAHRVRVDADGRYVARVAPGRYRVEMDRLEGLRGPSVVPGYRSGWLRLRADRPTRLDFATRPAATVTGLLTVAGEPVVDRLVAISDARGRWIARVPTDEDGRFTVESLETGRYLVQTLAFTSDEVPVSRWVDLRRGKVVRADLETTAGASVRFALVDGDRTAEVAVEVRNAEGELTRAFELAAGERYRVPGFAAGTYQVAWRRLYDPRTGEPEDVLPWTQRSITVTGEGLVDLGQVSLDRPTLRLSGTLPPGTQVKFATYPADDLLRATFVDGPSATPLTQPLTAVADARGRFASAGWVPGRYAATISTALRNADDGQTSTGANVAVHRTSLTFGATDRTAMLTAPVGGVLTARLHYAGTDRPLIAPVGYEVLDGGPRTVLFPTVSGRQTYAGRVRVDRLHAGRVTGRLLDYERLGAEADAQSAPVPDSLLDSAPFAEARTPYWLSALGRTATVRTGRTTDLGVVAVTVRR